MTLSISLAMFAAMVVLATIPGPGIMIVVARTLSQGFAAGVVTSAGIVAGDYVFIVLAISGLATLAQHYADLFLYLKYAGAAYLIYLGVKTVLTKNLAPAKSASGMARHSTNFIAGLLTTLSNPKAILFYVSLFPAFLDLSVVSAVDIGLIMAITTLSVGGVMVVYAWLAARSGALLKSTDATRYLRWGAGTVLIGSGAYIAARS